MLHRRPYWQRCQIANAEIATRLLEGLSYAQIGKELFITRSTVSFHLTRIYAKTGTTSRHELAQATHNATRAPRHRANS